MLSRCGSSNRGVFYNVTVDEVFSPSFGALSTTSSNHNRSFRNAADRRCSRSWGSECKIRVRATLPSCSLERKSPPIVVALPADCATSAAATTRDRRIDSCAGWVGPLPGAIERALSGSRRHTRRCRGRLDAPAATRVGNPPIRANARVGQGYTYASVGRVETDSGTAHRSRLRKRVPLRPSRRYCLPLRCSGYPRRLLVLRQRFSRHRCTRLHTG